MARPSRRRRQELTAGGTPAAGRPATARTPSSIPSRYRTQRVNVPRPWWQSPWAWGSAVVVVVVAVVVVFVVVASQPSATSAGSNAAQPVPASVLSDVTGVSSSVSSTIAAGGLSDPLEPVSGSPTALTGPDGNPELLYVGAEYCPYCAAERWSVVVALSRFGTFSNLHVITSSSTDVYPNTNTFSFYQSSYSSSYLDFVPLETETRTQTTLQTPTAAEQTLISTYDSAPYSSQAGGIPFMDLGNSFIVSGTAVPPTDHQGMTWQQIAATLSNPKSPVALAIIGDANWLTAGICKVTGGQPGSVCGSSTITALESELASS